MIECLDRLDSDPSNGLRVKLVDRAYETAAGSLALIAIGHLREAEILSRSVYESAVTTAYIAKESQPLRLAQFFRSYVSEERKQNRKWEKDVESASLDIRQDHIQRIRQKDEAMDTYKQFIDHYIDNKGIDTDMVMKWPGLIDRFTALGWRIEYRTVYSAMCSQAHHDAEDVLNHCIANSIAGTDEVAKRMEREADTFSVFMVLHGLQKFVEAILAVSLHLKFPTVVAEGINSHKRIMDEFQEVVPHLNSGVFPKNWLLRAAD
jgi:hypothetical protein